MIYGGVAELGLRRHTRNVVCSKGHREFKSHPHRFIRDCDLFLFNKLGDKSGKMRCTRNSIVGSAPEAGARAGKNSFSN